MHWSDLDWLDFVLLLIIGGSFFTSVIRGFSQELIGLAATLLGILFGIWFYGLAGDFLLPYVSSPAVAHFCGFLIVFIGVQILGSIVGWVLKKLLRKTGLTWVDRLLGGAFGLARGMLVAIAVVMAIMAFAPGARSGDAPESIVNSRLAPYVVDAADLVTRMAPRELKDEFRTRYKQIHKLWGRAVGETRP